MESKKISESMGLEKTEVGPIGSQKLKPRPATPLNIPVRELLKPSIKNKEGKVRYFK